MTSRRLTAIALGLTVAALVAIGVLAYRGVDQLADDASQAANGRELIAAVDAVLAVLRDGQTAARGYVVSGDDEELSTYRTAQTLLTGRLENLRVLAARNPARVDLVREVDATVQESRRLTDASLTARRDPGSEQSAALAAYRQERAAGARVQAAAARLLNAERQAQTAREDAAAARASVTRLLIVAVFAMAIGTSLFAGVQIRRELGRRRGAEQAALSAYREVEARIRERTRELSEANERLRHSEEQFRVIAEVSPVHLFTNAPDGSATYVSPGFSAFTGLPHERILGFGWTEAVHPDDRGPVVTAWQQAVNRGDRFQSDFRIHQANGGYRWFRVRVVPVRDESGDLTQWVGALADIHDQQESLTARALALQREQQARADAEHAVHLKDDFLATVSHELRTPLNAIIGWVHVLRKGLLPADKTERAVEAIENNARAQSHIVDDLLDVSRMIQGRLTLSVAPCDLGTVVRSALDRLEPASTAKHLAMTVDARPGGVVVNGDRARLEQVVWNLLSNAVKFTPKDGRISVALRRVGSRAVLEVADSGEGIDPAFLPHVFDAFRQDASRSMRAGLGLGLAIVQEVVELHGGAVAAQSPGVGRGAVFTVTLPTAGAPTRHSPAGAQQVKLAGVRVLVAEGEEDSAVLLSTVLSHQGCEVRMVASAHEFLSALVQWRPQVLVCDVGLPDGDGYSLLRRVRSIEGFDAVPAIALSTNAHHDDRLRALSAGYRAHLSKPLNAEALLREIGEASAIQPLA